MPDQKPWDVPIGAPSQAAPPVDPGIMSALVKKLFGGGGGAPQQALGAVSPMLQGGAEQAASGPAFSGDQLTELMDILKKQKQKAAILGGQMPPQ